MSVETRKVDDDEAGMRLDRWFHAHFPALPFGHLQKLLRTGQVRVDPNVEHAHHHLICTVCGNVRDVLVDVRDLRLPARDRRGFTVADVEVHFRGVCDDCAPRQLS